MWLRMTLVIVTLVTAGCVAIPYHASESSETFIEEETLKFIEIGQSTRAELQQTIGLPDWSFNDGSRWIYKVSMFTPGGWGGCYIEVVSPEGSAGCGKSDDEPIMAVLDLSISNLGVISKQEISRVKMGACTQTGVCLDFLIADDAWESAVTLLVSPEEEAHVKQFQAEPEQCVVFLYAESPYSNLFLSVDSVRVSGGIRTDAEFRRLRLDPGEHRILVAHSFYESVTNPGIIDINCLAGGVHFLRGRFRPGTYGEPVTRFPTTYRHYPPVLALVPDDLGRSAVMAKTFRLLPDSALMDKRLLPLPDSVLLPSNK